MTGTERKALNKYFPPDFDPRKIPKCKFERNRQYVIRVMAPFNMRCNTCGEYIYKGKKFNARRETVEDNDYLGLSLFRFYIRCPGCLAEITFTTDLKNCDYANEHGATRLFEAEKLLQAQDRELLRQEAEDATNPMKMLEKRTKMSRFEMDALERLEELKEMNQRHAKTDHLGMIKEVTKERELALKRQEEEDEAFVKAVFHGKKSLKRSGKVFDTQDDEDGGLVEETNSDEEDVKPSISHLQPKERDKPISKKPKLLNQKALLSGIVVKKPAIKETKNAVTCSPDTDKPSTSTTTISSVHSGATASSGLSLLGNYDGSSDENSD